MQRVLPWIAVIAAALVGIFAAVELRTRWDEDEMAIGPTLEPTPSELPTPPSFEPSPLLSPAEQTDIPQTPRITAVVITPTATIMAAESPTEEPAVAPTAQPSVPTPEPSGDPMPHTGGGAVGGGLAVIGIAALLGIAVRRSYSTQRS